MAKITTDKRGAWANVTRLGVDFKDGEGHTSDPVKVAFFRRHGDVYRVHERQTRRNGQESGSSQANSSSGDKPSGDDKSGAEKGAQGSGEGDS